MWHPLLQPMHKRYFPYKEQTLSLLSPPSIAAQRPPLHPTPNKPPTWVLSHGVALCCLGCTPNFTFWSPTITWKRERDALWVRPACSAMRSTSSHVAKGEGGFREWARKSKTLLRTDSIKVDGKEKEASCLKGAGTETMKLMPSSPDSTLCLLSQFSALYPLLPTVMSALQHVWDFHGIDHGPDVLARITGMLCLKSLRCSVWNESFKVTLTLI